MIARYVLLHSTADRYGEICIYRMIYLCISHLLRKHRYSFIFGIRMFVVHITNLNVDKLFLIFLSQENLFQVDYLPIGLVRICWVHLAWSPKCRVFVMQDSVRPSPSSKQRVFVLMKVSGTSSPRYTQGSALNHTWINLAVGDQTKIFVSSPQCGLRPAGHLNNCF